MKALISFDESSHVEQHTADIDIVPRQGDLLDLPDIGKRGPFPVERVIFRLARTAPGMARLEVPAEGPAVRIYLGRSIEKADSES
jgi:hypothetical protein